VSETLARTSADGSQGGAPAPQEGSRPAWLTPVNLVIIITTLVALGLRVYYQYTRPGFLLGVTEYDDGPYFGSAVRLVHGSLPYRDFILVQPPGITLLMSPVGLLTYWTGTGWGLAIGRILTVLAGTAGVALAGLLVRHRGPLAALLTCGIMAVYSDSVAAAHTVLVEPWLVLFCLAGAVAVFDGDRITASTRRLAWGGVLFGFAGAVEAWAIVPVLVLAALCLPQIKRAAIFAGGVAAGFVIPVLPFAIAGPSGLYRSLITAQVGYRAHAVRVGVLLRLRNMIGFPYALGWSKSLLLLAVLALVVFVVVTQAAAIVVTRQPQPTLDWFATISAVLIVVMFLWPPQFHYHFAEFLSPFMALTLALPVSRLLGGAQPDGGVAVTWPRTSGPKAARQAGLAITAVAAIALAMVAAFQFRFESAIPRVIGPIPATIDRLVPPGACVLTDQVSVTLAANRFVSTDPACPKIVDSLGSTLALSDGLKPQTGAANVPAVNAAWNQAFSHAQYVILTATNTRRIAWSPQLEAYFASHFTQLYESPRRLILYVRKGLRAG
jgi:alpha-1,2-mannosyltransferase